MGSMPKRSSIASSDSLANSIEKQPTDEQLVEKAIEDGKNPYAVLLGRKGGLKGGKARAASLSAEKRSEIAKKAARKRWDKK